MWTRIQVFHDNNRDFKSRTLFVGGERCPVALFKSLVFFRAKTSIKTSMRWSVFFYLSSKRNRKFKHLVQTKPMGENTVTNIMKVSVAGTSLKRVRKFTNRRARKTTVSKLKKAMIVYMFINFLNDYDEADKEERGWLSCNRPNEIMKTPALRKSKYYINTGSFRLHNNCGSTHPSMAMEASKENKTNCLPHFRVLNLKNFSMNPAMMGSQEQTMMNSR